jgi:uncharacterized protein YdeI (YjbR/CyaY-like superfamily)
MTETGKDGLPILEADGPAFWERWLEANHASPGVWLKFAKKAAPVTTITYAQALEIALCFGWIDGQVARHDEHYSLQRFTPRSARSKWSLINTEKATALIEAGRMREPGMAAVEAAKADGRWDAAYPPASQITVPEDLRRALDADPPAAAFFATLAGSRRYAFLYRLHNVNAPEARARRIAQYVERLGQGRTLQD